MDGTILPYRLFGQLQNCPKILVILRINSTNSIFDAYLVCYTLALSFTAPDKGNLLTLNPVFIKYGTAFEQRYAFGTVFEVFLTQMLRD